MANVFQDLSCEWRRLRSLARLRPQRLVYLGCNVGYRSLWLDSSSSPVSPRSEMINPPPIVIIALQSVAVHQAYLSILIYGHSPTSLSTHSIFVLSIHDFLAEIAFINVEVRAIQRDQARQKDVLDLLRLRIFISRLT